MKSSTLLLLAFMALLAGAAVAAPAFAAEEEAEYPLEDAIPEEEENVEESEDNDEDDEEDAEEEADEDAAWRHRGAHRRHHRHHRRHHHGRRHHRHHRRHHHGRRHHRHHRRHHHGRRWYRHHHRAAPLTKAQIKARRAAHLAKLYNALLVKYRSLRREVTARVKAIMWRKYAFLKMENAKHKWSLLNKRYTVLAKRFGHLASKHFLVRAYKKYTHTAEYQVRRNTKAYELTAKKSNFYLHNLKVWIVKQQHKILRLKGRMGRYLRKNRRHLGKAQSAEIRAQFHKRLVAEKKRLARIMAYWKARIGSGRIPAVDTSAATRAKLLAPKRALTPHPMVPYLHGAKRYHKKHVKHFHKPNKWWKPIRHHNRHLKHKKAKYLNAHERKWQAKMKATWGHGK